MPCTTLTRCAPTVFHELNAVSIFRWRYSKPTMEPSSRLFLCAHCRKQVIICRRCDRGQIYCPEGCSQIARLDSLRAAARRYQQSRPGRLNHAERTRRYRRRQQKVTHQGSEPTAPNDLLSTNPPISRKSDVLDAKPVVDDSVQCHFCGQRCSAFVRQDFLRHRRFPNIVKMDRRGAQHDHFP